MGLFRRSTPPQTRRHRFRVNQPRALTASAASVGVEDARQASTSHAPVAGTMSRIELALGFYSSEGACWNPAQFFSRSMKRIRYYPAILNDEGEPEEATDGQLRDLFDQIHDPGGTGMAQLASNYGRLAFLIGDGYLIVSEQDGEEVWEYLSPLELKKQRGTEPQQWRRNNGAEEVTLTEAGENEEIKGDRVRVWRLYRRSPTYSAQSDSPVFAVLNLYALLARLNLAAGATSWSRAANRGMLYVPDEVDLGGQDDETTDPGVDEDPLEDSSIRELVEAFTSPISDPGSVEGAAPVVLRGPALFEPPGGGNPVPFAQLIANIPIGTANPYFELDAVPKVIEQIALGLDMPNEMVTGTGKVNHWGGWLLDEQGFRQHVAGVVEDFCDDIASAFLRPAAIAEGIPDADRVVVWYDPVAAIAHPDQGSQALDALKVGAVGREYLRAAIGAGDEDAATPEDEAFLLELLGRKPAPDPAADGETAPQSGGTGGDTTEAPPAEPVNGNGGSATASAHVKAAMILGAAEMQIRQARKAAGARLVQRSKSCGECQDAIKDVPLGMVASTLGVESVRQIINGHTDEAALVCGVGDLLAEQVREFGVRGPYPAQLGAMVESHALRTLYEGESPRLPAGFAAVVAKALR